MSVQGAVVPVVVDQGLREMLVERSTVAGAGTFDEQAGKRGEVVETGDRPASVRHLSIDYMDAALDVMFFVVHTCWIAFNCLGWIWRRTRPWQLATVSLTALSWFGLGLWFGWGYCPCTDWHWQVRERLGFSDPPSYIQLLVHETTGILLPTTLANALAVVTLVVTGLLGVILSARDRAAARRASEVVRGRA